METPSIQEIMESDWYKTRPEAIQQAIVKMPPTVMYRFKDSKKECYILAYTEGDTENDPVTLVVQKTGKGGILSTLGMPELDTNQVFEVSIDDLELIEPF
jgi:hypothetical protein